MALSVLLLPTMTAAQAAGAPATVEIPPGRWALTTQTLLPHLEEALRYATTREERCLAATAADELFPVLRHEALAGCTLETTHEANVYALHCRNAQAASGQARVDVSGAALTAVLDLKVVASTSSCGLDARGGSWRA